MSPEQIIDTINQDVVLSSGWDRDAKENTKELLAKLTQDQPTLAPYNLWEAYRQLEEVKGGRPISELAALVALVRRVIGIDGQLTTYKSTIDKNFKQWVFGKQAGAAEKFTQEQMEWLRMLKDHGRAE